MQAVPLLRQARTAAKAGQRQQAYLLLKQAVRQDPENHLVWLWLAKTSPSPQLSLDYVKQAQQLRPEDARVKKARAWAERRAAKFQTESSQISPPTNGPVSAPRPWSALLKRSRLLLALALLVAGGIIFWNSFWTADDAASGPAGPVLTPIATASDENTVIRLAANTLATETAVPIASATPTSTSPQMLAKKVTGQNSDPRPTWTATPRPTNTPTATPSPMPTFVSSDWQKPEGRPLGIGADERWIDVDLSEQTLYAYQGSTLIFETLISSGLPDHETVTGQFRIWYRTASQTMDGARLGYDYYLENVPYVMYFFEDYALHGTYWHNNFGRPMSHGCVNMRTEDAGWVFEWAKVGTLVNVHQ